MVTKYYVITNTAFMNQLVCLSCLLLEGSLQNESLERGLMDDKVNACTVMLDIAKFPSIRTAFLLQYTRVPVYPENSQNIFSRFKKIVFFAYLIKLIITSYLLSSYRQ